jgi:hypothetical protein
MSVTQLSVYNRALTALGQRRLATITEQCEPRRVLDDLWADCLQYCLEQGMWNFAMINSSLAADMGSGDINYSHKYDKPGDLVHLFAISSSSTYDPPLVNDFVDQQAHWYANVATVYLRYTSNDGTSGGGNLGFWTQTFATYVAHVLAAWSAVRITGSEAMAQAMEVKAQRYLLAALAIDSVPMLPGMRPFNAEARSKPVESHQPTPVEMAPFFIAGGLAAQAAPAAGGDTQR